LNDKHLYKFGDFELLADENVLERKGEGVSLTPKMYEMLLVLVRNRGQIVEKERLLEEVWPDSFVEEGNISYNIRQLRKALDDDAQSPIFIETVPRRGYRFIAEVEEIVPSAEPAAEAEETEPTPLPSAPAGHRRFLHPAAIGFLAALVIGTVGYFLISKPSSASFPILSTPFTAEKLSTTGMVYGVAISPDGRRVVYSNRSGGKQSVWLRDLDSGSNVPIIQPAEEHHYYEFTFAPDGNSIYFTRLTSGAEAHIDMFRVSAIGGIPEKIVGTIEGSLSVSPDGSKISFVRCPRREDEWCSLWIADAKDGGNERKLVTRPNPIRIGDIEISPDGTRIAFAAGQSRNAANDFSLSEFNLETGAVREITNERFFNIKNIIWLPDQSGLLLTASRVPNKHFRIWQVSASSGGAEPLTKDSEAYSILSLDKEAKNLVATQIKQDFRLNVFNIDNPSEKRFVADASWASFARDGKIYFSSPMSGNDEIWSINTDGSGQRQLTNDPAGESYEMASADGKTVFFVSNRDGEAHVWRMNPDGSGQTRVTQKGGGVLVHVTPDGKLLYYRHAILGTLWSVSFDTGEEKQVFDQFKPHFAISPDGSTVAFEEKRGDDLALTLISLADGKTVKSFVLPKERPRLLEFLWTPDGTAILYLMTDIEYLKNAVYRQPLAGGPAQKITDLTDETLTHAQSLTIAPDGKTFGVVQGVWKHDAVLFKGLK
jgi:Tol biopolymer transport system component/DNA-binding winged helix-turn-helix (wHTH) protein